MLFLLCLTDRPAFRCGARSHSKHAPLLSGRWAYTSVAWGGGWMERAKICLYIIIARSLFLLKRTALQELPGVFSREREGWGACWVVTQHTRYATFVGPINHLRCENMLVLYPLPVNNLLAMAVFLCWVLGHEYNYRPLPMNMARWIEWIFVSIYWGLWSRCSLGEQWLRTNTLWRADGVEICQEFTWVGSLWSLKCTLASALQNTCRERERERE